MIPNKKVKSTPRRTDPIGVFDSGVGGLSVLRELEKAMPHERFVFVADQTHVPYGGKTPSQLCSLSSRITRFLLARRCKLIVVACNTATCYAIEHLRETFAVPFVGTVPAIKPAAAMSVSGIIGSISTPATAKSPTVRMLVRTYARNVKVLIVGCPGLEELVETGGVRTPGAKVLLAKYLSPIVASGADTLVLGCTHYPFLKSAIRSVAPSLRTVDSGRAIARRTKSLLGDSGLLNTSGRRTTRLFTTKDPVDLSRVATILMRRPVRADHARI